MSYLRKSFDPIYRFVCHGGCVDIRGQLVESALFCPLCPWVSVMAAGAITPSCHLQDFFLFSLYAWLMCKDRGAGALALAWKVEKSASIFTWLLGIKLRLAGFTTRAFTCQAILLALSPFAGVKCLQIVKAISMVGGDSSTPGSLY